MSVNLEGINTIRDKKSGKVHYYCRYTKTRLPSPDSPDFLDEVVATRAQPKKKKSANGSGARKSRFGH